jgi:hypothetical protein
MTEFSLPWMDDFHSSPQIGTESDSRVINLVVNFNEFAMPWMVLLIPTISHRISSIHQLPSNQASKEGRIHPGFIENLPHLYIYIYIYIYVLCTFHPSLGVEFYVLPFTHPTHMHVDSHPFINCPKEGRFFIQNPPHRYTLYTNIN